MMILTNNDFIGMADVLGCPVIGPEKHLDGIVKKIGMVPSLPATILVSGDGLGRTASSLSKDHNVYGLSQWTDAINMSIYLKIELALRLSMKIPEYKICTNQEEMDDVCANGWDQITKTVAFKRHDGLPLCVEAFYNNGKFRNYFIRVGANRLLYGNVGPLVHNPLTTTFSMPSPKMKPWFLRLADIIARESSEYKGPVELSGIIHGDVCVFKDIRFGYDFDYELAKMRLCSESQNPIRSSIILGEGKIPKGYASTVRMYDIRQEGLRLGKIVNAHVGWVHPLHCKFDMGTFISTGDTPFVVVGVGDKIVTSFTNAFGIIRGIKIQELCYRSDGGKYATEWWKASKTAGIL